MRVNVCRWLWAAALVMILSLPACAGWIYDQDDGTAGADDRSFTLVDASRYTAWAYVNLATKQAITVDEYGEWERGTPPREWHFAMHRFDCKTNGAQVLETRFETIDALVASGAVPEGEFIPDEPTTDVIAYDMSRMMEGVILYAESDYNPEMSKWMDVDLDVMPPIYTPSNKVYVLRFADGTMAAVRFTGFTGPMEVKGYNSFDYIYPLEF